MKSSCHVDNKPSTPNASSLPSSENKNHKIINQTEKDTGCICVKTSSVKNTNPTENTQQKPLQVQKTTQSDIFIERI